MNFKVGTIYHFKNCETAYPPKNKFAVCISSRRSFFYLINSIDDKRPYAYEEKHVVFLETSRVECLSHKSYINVSKVREIQQKHDVQEKNILSNDLLLKIRNKVKNNKKLSNEYKNIILEE
ncbi:MAG: hypothetical protein LBI95_02790, partial [Holosporales bacterium]|nr:hypothetical protein [Holosporales bacterium]